MNKLGFHNDILSVVGNTPLVRIFENEYPDINFLLKLEMLNPAGSVKDRVAVALVEDAEEQGILHPGMTVIEPSSGNMAIGMAMTCALKGYRFIALIDRFVPSAKADRIRALGGSLLYLPPTEPGFDTAELRIALAKKIAAEHEDVVTLMQFENETNIKIHYETTGPEIWNALQGNVAAVFLCVGSCGTITGVGRALKERDPSIKIFGVDSHGSTVFGGKATPYFVQGGGLAFDPPLLDRKVVDEGIKVADQDAFNCGRQLAKEQGILLGGTASCAVHAARTRMSQFSAGDNVVVVVPDGGDRYLDNFYDKDWIEKRGFSFEEPLPFDAKIQATCEKYQCELHVA